MKKFNFLKQVWDSKRCKDIKFSKMPKGKQDFINTDKPIEMGLKDSSGPENVKGLKKFDKKINKMADDLFGDEINTYMENTKQNRSKFDMLYENILNGMSEEDKLELGVPSDEAEDDSSFDDFDDDSGEETVTITLTKDQVKCLKAICEKLADEDVEDESEGDVEETDETDESEDWEESEDEDEDVAEDTSFGEGIETEVVSPEKGKKYMNKASNKVGGKPTVKGGKANKGKIPAIKEDPEELPSERGKHYQKKEANKVKSSLNAGNDLF